MIHSLSPLERNIGSFPFLFLSTPIPEEQNDDDEGHYHARVDDEGV